MSDEVQSKYNERDVYRVDESNYFSPHIRADDRGIITICVNGECRSMPIRDWHKAWEFYQNSDKKKNEQQ